MQRKRESREMSRSGFSQILQSPGKTRLKRRTEAAFDAGPHRLRPSRRFSCNRVAREIRESSPPLKALLYNTVFRLMFPQLPYDKAYEHKIRSPGTLIEMKALL